MTHYVTCIRKRGSHHDPHERIEGLGGAGWFKLEDAIISDIEHGTNNYVVNVGVKPVAVKVATHNGRKYLKTEADDVEPNNLLALPECPSS